jgi:hypothetical protein
MIDINKEAEEYSKSSLLNRKAAKHFIAGHNSKATQAKVLQAQINILLKYQQKLGGYEPLGGALKQEIQLDIYEFQQRLKELENGN